MNMSEVDHKMEHLFFNGIRNPDEILHHMIGYLPEMHELWKGTTDEQLMYLSTKYPYFKEFALILERGFQVERNKGGRPYDEFDKFTEEQGTTVKNLIQQATDIDESISRGGERSIKADIWRDWQTEFNDFTRRLAKDGVDPRVIEAVEAFFQPVAARVNGMFQGTVTIKPDILTKAEKIYNHVSSIESQGGGDEQLLFILTTTQTILN